MHRDEEYLRIADELLERARRFSSGVGYEAGVRDTLEAIAPLVRTLNRAALREGDRDRDLVEAGAELRRISAQLVLSAIQIGNLLRRLQRRGDRASSPVDLQSLDSAARLLMDAALQIDSLLGSSEPRSPTVTGAGVRHDVNYLAALALALVRAGEIDEDRLVQQLRDVADHRPGVLIEAAARLAHEHDTSEEAAGRAINVLERAAQIDPAV